MERLFTLFQNPEIFQETTEFDYGKLAKRFQELAFLNKVYVSLL